MSYADRVKETCSAAIGTGNIVLAGAAAGFQTFAAGFTVGAALPYCIVDASGNWETGIGTLTGATTLTRGVSKSSNGNSLVNFGAGSKDVFCTPLAAQLAALQISQDIAFATAIPLTVAGTQYMPQQTVASVLAFTVASSPVKGASVYVRLLADGTNAPTFTGMKEWGGSLGYDNRNGIANQVQFFFDGTDTFYSISQAIGAVPAPAAVSGVTMTGPTSGIASTTSTNFSVGVTPVGGTITGTVVVTPSDASGGGTFAPTSVSLSSGAPTGTFTYTPNSTVTTRTISVTNNGGLSNPTAINYTVTASATVPATMSAPVATGGDASASVAFTAPSNGGAAIIDYTVTSSPGGFTATGASSPLTVTGLTNGTGYTFTVKARNSVGSSVASAASNSVAPAAAASTVRLNRTIKAATESASAPWIYTGTGTQATDGSTGAISVVARPANTNAEAVFKVVTLDASYNAMVQLTLSTSVVSYTNNYAIWAYSGNGMYKAITLGTIQAPLANVTPAAGDLLKIAFVNSTGAADFAAPMEFSVSQNNGSTWTLIYSVANGRQQTHYATVTPGGASALSCVSTVGFA